MRAMWSFSENTPSDNVNNSAHEYAFFCTKVIVQQLIQPFIRMKNDIGSDGTLSLIQYLACHIMEH